MGRVSKIVVAADPQGDAEAVRQLGKEATRSGAHAIALLGNLRPSGADVRVYGAIFKALAEPRLPAYYVPGPEDAPFSEFLREAANFEIVFPHLRCVHGTFAIAPGYIVLAGMGGTIEDAPHTTRDELETLRYPAWEVEYRLKSLLELKDYQKIFMFTTPPEHKGRHEAGSATLAEIIKQHRVRVALVAGRGAKQELIARSLVVCPGSLAEGSFSLIDLRQLQVTPGILHQFAKVA